MVREVLKALIFVPSSLPTGVNDPVAGSVLSTVSVFGQWNRKVVKRVFVFDTSHSYEFTHDLLIDALCLPLVQKRTKRYTESANTE